MYKISWWNDFHYIWGHHYSTKCTPCVTLAMQCGKCSTIMSSLTTAMQSSLSYHLVVQSCHHCCVVLTILVLSLATATVHGPVTPQTIQCLLPQYMAIAHSLVRIVNYLNEKSSCSVHCAKMQASHLNM